MSCLNSPRLLVKIGRTGYSVPSGLRRWDDILWLGVKPTPSTCTQPFAGTRVGEMEILGTVSVFCAHAASTTHRVANETNKKAFRVFITKRLIRMRGFTVGAVSDRAYSRSSMSSDSLAARSEPNGFARRSRQRSHCRLREWKAVAKARR